MNEYLFNLNKKQKMLQKLVFDKIDFVYLAYLKIE